MLEKLYGKDNHESYQYLLSLVEQTKESDFLYENFGDFINMLNSKNNFVKVRGFTLICALAKWDFDNKINNHINEILETLDSEYPALVRQCIINLQSIILYKPELKDIILSKCKTIDVSKYKDTMSGLIVKDIDMLTKIA